MYVQANAHVDQFVFRVRMYSVDEDTSEQEQQLEEIVPSHLHLPPELEFYAIVYRLVDY